MTCWVTDVVTGGREGQRQVPPKGESSGPSRAVRGKGDARALSEEPAWPLSEDGAEL